MKSLVLLTVACLSCSTFGEIVNLNDGSKIEGEVHPSSDGWVVTQADGKTIAIAADRVKSIDISKPANTPDTATRNLASLRRALAAQGDAKLVVERYKAFIAQNSGTPAAKEAARDMAQWQERLDKGLIRVGDQWVTHEQLTELQARALDAADKVRPLIAAGKLNEALALLNKSLAVAPQNAALLYLKGVIQYRQQQIVPARKAFEGAEAQAPESGATENNLAVILWRQHAEMPALLHYQKAMIADPVNEKTLNNVAEALHALPEKQRANPLTKKVKDLFNDQDSTLQKQMAEKGLYRSGSGWLSEKEFNKQQAQEKAVQEKIDALKKDFTDIQTRLIRIDRDIADDTNVMNAIVSESVQIDPQTNRQIQFPLPQRYYDLQRDVKSLQTEKVMKQRELAQLPKQAADLEKTKPAKKYTGVQKIIDVEGMPGASQPSPGLTDSATPPATRPAADRASEVHRLAHGQ